MKNGMKILTMYLSMIGYAAIMMVIFHTLSIMDSERLMLFIRGVVIGGVPVAVINTYIFRTGIDKFELWMRRIIALALGITIIVISFVLVGLIDTSMSFLRTAAGGFGLALVICVPAYILLDRRANKSIQKINDKLSEQNKEEKQEEHPDREVKEDWH